jgi:hypothetical protein
MQITIETEQGKKGRSFSAELMAYIDAPGMTTFGPGGGDVTRPIWMCVATSDSQSKAFVANLRTGKPAESTEYRKSTKFQLMKSARYLLDTQKYPDGVLSTLYLPEIMHPDPGMVDPDWVSFVMLADPKWMERQGPHGEAMLFMSYVDRRTRFPMPTDTGFAQEFMATCLREGLAQRHEPGYNSNWGRKSFTYREFGLDRLGLSPGLAMHTTHTRIQEILAALLVKG